MQNTSEIPAASSMGSTSARDAPYFALLAVAYRSADPSFVVVGGIALSTLQSARTQDRDIRPRRAWHDASVATVTEPVPRLINRELSWVEFNARLLELAADDSLPLLERVKFGAIFANGFDEFFMVRVAGLLELEEADLGVRSADGMTPSQALEAIRKRVGELVARQSRVWKRDLRPALSAEGIEIVGIEDCSPKELDKLGTFFEREIYPVLTPLAVGPGQPFPYISGLSLSLGVLAVDPSSAEERFARVKVPEGLDRFVAVGKRLVPLEARDRPLPAHAVPGDGDRRARRVPRHAGRRLRGLGRRRRPARGGGVRAAPAPLRRRRPARAVELRVAAMRERLIAALEVRPSQVYEIEGLIDLADLWQLVGLDRPELKYAAWVPVVPPRWARVKSPTRVFEEIRRSDMIVHHPYESFRASFEALAQAAARDPDVIAIKTTVYRTSDDSALISSLIECAEEGKQSVCLVELKARFDERRNIEWSRAMEQAGVHVVHGFADLKIHAKMTLVVRREENGLRRYVHIGTGNYNAATARIYEDVGIFTADEEIAADVADLFNYVTGFGRPQRFRKILVAPFDDAKPAGRGDPARCTAAARASRRASG